MLFDRASSRCRSSATRWDRHTQALLTQGSAPMDLPRMHRHVLMHTQRPTRPRPHSSLEAADPALADPCISKRKGQFRSAAPYTKRDLDLDVHRISCTGIHLLAHERARCSREPMPGSNERPIAAIVTQRQHELRSCECASNCFCNTGALWPPSSTRAYASAASLALAQLSCLPHGRLRSRLLS